MNEIYNVTNYPTRMCDIIVVLALVVGEYQSNGLECSDSGVKESA